MRRVHLVIFLFSLPALTTNSTAQPKLSVTSQIDSLIQAEKRLDFTGSVLVAKGSTVLHKRNYGLDLDQEYSYWIASLSKQFCAASILRLRDNGLLSTDDTISKYLQDVPQSKKSITFHQLLTHTSGLGDHYSADGITGRNEAINEILSKDSQPTETYRYSSDGYQLLAALVEIISGKSYEEFLQSEFFEPLKMSHTGFSGDLKKWNSLAIPPWSKRKTDNLQTWPTNYGYKGATGIITSVQDLMQWQLALFDRKVLSESSTDLLFTRHVEKQGELFYGYGWNLFDSSRGEVIVHSGSDDFVRHNSTLRHFKDSKITIIVLDFNGSFKGTSKARILAGKLISIAHNAQL
ncbi:MAG: serine hydrolase domain-containing protein [Cyclobacteriaceae bacterium]